MSDVLLRPASSGDAAAVAEAWLAARDDAVARGLMPAAVHAPDEVRAWIAGRLAPHTTDEVWVAECAEEVAGYARLTRTWLDDLYVAPAWQGQGIGAALLDLVKSLRPDGFGLWVFESNVAAQRFYVRHGLLVTERTDGSDNEERAPDLRMEWPGTR